MDTVFFVLRKKEKQVTFLHMYHHSSMYMISWGVTKYQPGGHGTFIGMMNAFVHIIMYIYYFFAAMGPQYQKYLWWKKYITTMQMVRVEALIFCNETFFLVSQWTDEHSAFPVENLYLIRLASGIYRNL